jgi:hypothetical protein
MKNITRITIILSLAVLAMLVPGCISFAGSGPTPTPTLAPTATAVISTTMPVPTPTPTVLPITGPQNIVQTTNGRWYPTLAITNGSPCPTPKPVGGQLGAGQ